MDYRETLLAEFHQRTRRNSSYSLRAFSRDIGIPASNLSSILRRKRGLSVVNARRLAKRLGMKGDEQAYFVALVEKEHGRSQPARTHAANKLQRLMKSGGFSQIALDHFALVADWIHFAILELTAVSAFRADPAWIARRLGTGRGEVEEALQKLLKLGFLKKTRGGLKETQADIATPGGDVPSRIVREHHRQLLAKAEAALDAVPAEQREFASMTMAIDASKLAEAKSALREFRRVFAKDMQGTPSKDRVYCLTMQFFPLDILDTESRG